MISTGFEDSLHVDNGADAKMGSLARLMRNLSTRIKVPRRTGKAEGSTLEAILAPEMTGATQKMERDLLVTPRARLLQRRRGLSAGRGQAVEVRRL
jgi:hypothetical protein